MKKYASMYHYFSLFYFIFLNIHLIIFSVINFQVSIFSISRFNKKRKKCFEYRRWKTQSPPKAYHLPTPPNPSPGPQVSTGDGWAQYIARPLVGNTYPNLIASAPAADEVLANNATLLTLTDTIFHARRSESHDAPDWAHPTVRRPVADRPRESLVSFL